ncbi:MAG TPA: CGNR zinc finger domain-containing protein [Mycobacterium sp.]|nr:CGNR zinc finger domain-containing protein [Mycobacterium sp.]
MVAQDVPLSRPDSPFWFIGGDISLDLVNTEMIESGVLVDRINTPELLRAWLDASSLGQDLGVPEQISQEVFDKVIDLRHSLRAGYDELAFGRTLPEGTILTLNDILGPDPGSRLRDGGGGRLERSSRVNLATQPWWLPWLLADAAADLIVSPTAALVRRCASQVCVLFFVDTSRNHSRRWCSMELCGNRNKVAAHHQRAREAGAGQV